MTNRRPDVHCYYCKRYMHSEPSAAEILYSGAKYSDDWNKEKPWCGKCDKKEPERGNTRPN